MGEALLLADAGAWLSRVVVGGFRQTLFQLLFLAAPFALIGLLLHWMEKVSQGRLSRRFGWRSVLWTGWLGTPVHELSHAALCLVFGHRIREIALFRPDESSGSLGYVRHTHNPKNPYHVVGNFFIGVAPLVGGTLVLYGLLWLFYSDAARQALSAGGIGEAISHGRMLAAGRMLARLAKGVIVHVVSLDSLKSWQFWLFIYLALCVGSHLGPSPADYRGAKTGGLLLLGLLLLFNLLFLALGGSPGAVAATVAPVLGPALALFALCAVLSAGSTLVVVALTTVV